MLNCELSYLIGRAFILSLGIDWYLFIRSGCGWWMVSSIKFYESFTLIWRAIMLIRTAVGAVSQDGLSEI